jgi:hypothetical protein
MIFLDMPLIQRAFPLLQYQLRHLLTASIPKVRRLLFVARRRRSLQLVPDAIFADLEILAKAPAVMVTAGFGDMLGKYTSLFDWSIGVRLRASFIALLGNGIYSSWQKTTAAGRCSLCGNFQALSPTFL